jgi:hypothetical protein
VWYLEQGGGVGDVVAHPPLRGDADLILLDGRILPRLLHPLVPVHPSSASLSLHALVGVREPAVASSARWRRCGGGGR